MASDGTPSPGDRPVVPGDGRLDHGARPARRRNHHQPQRFGVFGTTVVTCFLAERGDKTQIATVALAARYPDLVSVVAGTTLGMMRADVPAVFLGRQIAEKSPMRLVHRVAAAIFAVLGVLTLIGGRRML